MRPLSFPILPQPAPQCERKAKTKIAARTAVGSVEEEPVIAPRTRRGFVSATLGACWAGIARARAQTPPASPFRIERIAEGVYAAQSRPSALFHCNAIVFENSNSLSIVDTHSSISAAAALAAQLRKEIGAKPIRDIIYTHFHWDHIQGARAYRRLAPEARIIASTATRDLIAEQGAARFRKSTDRVARSLERLRRATPGTAEEPEYDKTIAEMEAYLAEMRDFTPEMPDIAFSGEHVIHDKAHDLHLVFHGRGHTAGDVTVFCPGKKVIATGDLADGSAPYIGDGYPREWPATLRAVLRYPFECFAGGHGAVQRSREPLHGEAAYIEELTAVVDRGRQHGRTVEDLQMSISPQAIRSLETTGYGRFLARAMGGASSDPLGAALRGNIAEIYQALERN